jgi:hypothetical protein
VTVGLPATSGGLGTTAAEELQLLVRARIGPLLALYRKELQKNPVLHGTLVLRFMLSPLGRVTELELEEDSVNDVALVAGTRSLVTGWTFRYQGSTDVQTSVALVFVAGDAPSAVPAKTPSTASPPTTRPGYR